VKLACGSDVSGSPLWISKIELMTTDDQKTSKPRRPKNAAKNGDTFKKLRLMVLCHEDLVPPDSIEGLSAKEVHPYKTEWDVISTLKKIGHEVYPVGVYNNLGVIRNALL